MVKKLLHYIDNIKSEDKPKPQLIFSRSKHAGNGRLGVS